MVGIGADRQILPTARVLLARRRSADHGRFSQDRRTLTVEPMQRALAAGGAQFDRIGLVKVDAEVLERFALDRQAVHVPTGDEVGPAPIKQMDLDERIFEHAIEEVAHVQIAVGVRRSIVQNPRLVDLFFAKRRSQVPFSFHHATRAGSLFARPARIGNSVFGGFIEAR